MYFPCLCLRERSPDSEDAPRPPWRSPLRTFISLDFVTEGNVHTGIRSYGDKLVAVADALSEAKTRRLPLFLCEAFREDELIFDPFISHKRGS